LKLSIITINYNDATGLLQTLNSVAEQTWRNYEHIIIDGGSSDESLTIIKKNESLFSYWVSESDRGIYNAMNKGVLKANGEYLLMLNAGDLLHNKDVLYQVFNDTNYTQDIIYGDVDRESKGVVFTESIFPDTLTFGFLRNGMISHQAAFFKRSLHDLVGMYDETLKYAADWNFIILAICKYNASYIHLNLKMALCSADGLTSNPSEFRDMEAENRRVLQKEFPAFIIDYFDYDEIERNKIGSRTKELLNRLVSLIKKPIKKLIKFQGLF
jgi:glycosyltransferase involved in cell wall biosynthesis